MKLQDRASFYQMLHRGIKSGLTLHQVLGAGLLPSTTPAENASLQQELDRGSSFTRAFSAAGILAPWEAELINVGEVSGNLEGVLSRLDSFFTQKTDHLYHIRSRLIFPFLIVFFAIVVLPFPQLAGENLSLSAYIVQSTVKLSLLYLVYRELLIKPIINAQMGSFNAWIVNNLKRVNHNHFLRLHFETSYLDLLLLCLNCGMDAASALKVLQRCFKNKDFYNRHTFAINNIENNGMALSEALSVEGILQNTQILSFMKTSEASGSLHSDMLDYIHRRKLEVAATVDYWIRRISTMIYAMVLIFTSLKILGV